MSTINADSWLAAIMSRDAMTFEEAYFGNRPAPSIMGPKIIAKLSETRDSYTRGKLIELLGECGDSSVIKILESELNNPDPAMQEWAKISIDSLKGGDTWQK